MNPDRSYHTNSSYIMRHDPTGPKDVDVMNKDYCGVCRGECRCKEACDYED